MNLYKVWDKQESAWVDPDYISATPAGLLLFQCGVGDPGDQSRFAIARFTGSLDVDDNAIYEGDRLQAQQPGWSATGPVEWSRIHNTWVFRGNKGVCHKLYGYNNLKIIGHIYDR